MNSYYNELNKRIVNSLKNEFHNNFDFEIRKLNKKIKYLNMAERIGNFLIKKINKNLRLNIFFKNIYWENIHRYEYLYENLSDQKSRNILIDLLAYKLLGHQKHKLSLNNDYYWRLRKIAEIIRQPETITANFRDGSLYLYDLSCLNFDIKLYYVTTGILHDFILEQYNYQDIVKVVDGDTVIDAGGCWGDTALYFASLGAQDVYTFEFISSNITIMKKNIDLNPQYKSKIHILENPVWDSTDIEMSYLDKGPSSKISKGSQFRNLVRTLSIDDLVDMQQLEKIDFIKMDIEGSEFEAIKGGIKTINKFKPKLAISAYHKPEDLYLLPKLIHSIRGDYQFYIDYYTIIGDEVILYAI